MLSLKEFFLNSLSGTIEQIAESKLVDVLQDLHDKDIVKYNAVVAAAELLTQELTPLVKKTKTPIDDAILGALAEAVQTSVDQNKS